MPKPPCSIDGCEKPARARGWCGTHYQRWKKHGDPLKTLIEERHQVCLDVDCNRRAVSKGRCRTHWSQWYRTNGEPCSEMGCDKTAATAGLCVMHLARLQRHGDTSVVLIAARVEPGASCSLPHCGHPFFAKGLCRGHYSTHLAAPKRRKNGGTRFAITKSDHASLNARPCAACGTTENLTVEHLIPVHRGGTHGIGNLTMLCGSCNSSKGALTWMEWRVSQRPRALLVFAA